MLSTAFLAIVNGFSLRLMRTDVFLLTLAGNQLKEPHRISYRRMRVEKKVGGIGAHKRERVSAKEGEDSKRL